MKFSTVGSINEISLCASLSTGPSGTAGKIGQRGIEAFGFPGLVRSCILSLPSDDDIQRTVRGPRG
jgi:hypothetical protein